MIRNKLPLKIFIVALVLFNLAGCSSASSKKDVIESSSSSYLNEASGKDKATQSKPNSAKILHDPAELACTGQPKHYSEFNETQQEAIGNAVDAVTNNIGVDRTMYNYTYEPDKQSGTIYIGRFNGSNLMDVILVDDKLLDFKGILDASTFAQQSNPSGDNTEQDYSDSFEGVWKIRNKAIQFDFHDGRAFIGYYKSNESEKIDLGEYLLDGTDFPVLRMEKEFEIGYSYVQSVVFEITSENSMRVTFYGGRNGNEARTFNADRKE